MKIIEKNLKQFIEIPENIYEITNNYITEVESITSPFAFNNLTIGHVLEVEKHENADTLSVTKVDLGTSIEQIVCGAPNVKVGQYVIVASEGAILPGDFKIKKSKIRGIESNGMICSLNELGLKENLQSEEDKTGIYYFKHPVKIGDDPIKALEIDGFILELDLTPNRGDLLSHLGFARDLGAVTRKNVKLPKFEVKTNGQKSPLTVKVLSKNTNSYYANYFDNVEIKESPLWLKLFLEQMGTKAINNVVDVTNYILYTYGIPMHAFDADKFKTNEIVVIDNNKSQKVITLEGEEVNLTDSEILITNGQEPMALGGVIGLDNSKIDDQTTKIILEVASFSKEQTRQTSKRLNVKSDSSLRFERGIDESVMINALNHATYLIQKLSNASVYQNTASDIVKSFENPWIEIDFDKLNVLIGENLTNSEIINILKALNYQIKDDKNPLVKAPSYRHDILIFADVLEEVVRIKGMDQISLKPMHSTPSRGLSERQKMVRKLRTYLANFGLNEIITYSLMPESEVFKYQQIGEVIKVLKAMSSDRSVMRQSLINGLVETKRYNLNHNNLNINLFEIGSIYAKGIEDLSLAILLSNNQSYNLWQGDNRKIDFYYLSGLLSNLMTMLSVDFELKVSDNDKFHPHQQANILVSGEVVGIIGKLHPNILDETYILEINLDKLNKNIDFVYESISKYPTVDRDIAILVDKDLLVADILKTIKQTLKKNLNKIELFDVYEGENIANHQRSLAFKLTISDKNKTLDNEEINKLITKVVKRLEFEYKAKLR